MEDILFSNRQLVTAGGTFSRPGGGPFIIEVKTTGSVVYTTFGGQNITESLTAGYHKMRLKSLGVSAVDVAVLFD